MQQLKRLRTAIDFIKDSKKLTNDKLAAELGYNKGNYISEILSGAKNLNNFFLKKLYNSFGISKEWILHSKGNMIDENQNTLREADAVYQTKNKIDKEKVLKEQLHFAMEQNKYLQSVIDRLLPDKNKPIMNKSDKKYK